MTRIIEIGDIAWQGTTEPVFCRGEDGNEYVVKGKRAGRRALIAEWVAGRLGQLLQLPLPDFTLMKVDPAMRKFSTEKVKLENLGIGSLFGSRRIKNAVELRHADMALIDKTLRARVLAFDWWIGNSDRVFVEGGGNPNLLWLEDARSLVVIDHNLAFDSSLIGNFWPEHAFRRDRESWNDTFREDLSNQFRRALMRLADIWKELPEDWTEIDCGLTFREVEGWLWRFEHDADKFWELHETGSL